MCIQRQLTHTACADTYTSTIHTPNCPFYSTVLPVPAVSINHPWGASYLKYSLKVLIPLQDEQHSLTHILDTLEQGGVSVMMDGSGKEIEVEVLKAVIKEGVCWACEKGQEKAARKGRSMSL